MAERAKKVSALPAEQLRRLMDRLRRGSSDGERIGRAPRDGGPLPLSFSQESLWFFDRLGAGSAAYNIPAAARLRGALDAAALEGAFGEVARRHESLRARFGEQDGRPFQTIAPEAGLELPGIDLSGLPEDRREDEALRWAAEAARLPFDLARGPLLRTFLFRLSAGHHVLALTLHHIVADGWSIGVLIREVAALYAAFAAGEPSPLPELSLQYTDYAVWQQNGLQGEALEREIAFWRERLAGTPPLDLIADRPRPSAQSFRGARRELALTLEETRDLHALGRRFGATPFMALLALFQILLLRFTGQTDLAVGSPLANRDRDEVQDLIGFFVNTLVLRTDLSGRPSVAEALRRVREVAVAAFAHAELPFEKLVLELHPEREAGRNPLFQALFTLQDPPGPAARIGDLELALSDLDTGTSKVDLTLVWREPEGRLVGWLEYATDLFEAATAERLLRGQQALLRAAAERPDEGVWELPLLDEAERRQILTGWNRTAAEYPRDTPVHRLVLRWAESEPERVAIEDGDLELTYGELRERAGQLAAHLQSLGIGPESRVGLCLERSADLGVAMLGILAAGGAYVPLDPGYPEERLSFMVEDAALAAVITEERFLPKLPAGLSEQGIAVLSLGEGPARAEARKWAAVSGDGLAYVLYTSGSTGRPKGVGGSHRAIARLVLGTDYVELTAEDRVAQVSNSSFDAATFEIWGALANGACLVGVDRDILLSPRRFASFLCERRITTLLLTTALFHQIVREVPDAFATLRHLLFGGEAADPRRVREALAARPERLLNLYGPTEGTTVTTWYPVTAVHRDAVSVPIGRPIANTRVYVVDPFLRPVPAGVAGELLAGGDGLARGYLGRPDLTAERFIPSPFAGEADEPGARLYRTGDRVRWLSGGVLEFLGRVDAQVKIRGFRIEPGEIEAALASHPEVREAAVVARAAAQGDRRLVAYVVPAGGGLTVPALRSHLGERLPAYMVPAAFVWMERLPLTANGKLDRRALPEPDDEGLEAGAAYEAPRGPAEELIAGVWADLLGVERVGVRDDFFALGGHSLLAAQAVSRLRSSLGVDLPVRALFENPTVAGLAKAARQPGAPAAAPPVRPRDSRDEAPLSFAQERLWFLSRLEPDDPAYNITAAVRLRGEASPAALGAALTAAAGRHEILRTTFREDRGRPVQAIAARASVPLPVVDLSPLAASRGEAEALRLAVEEARRPCDLERGPLVRAALVRRGAGEHLLLLTLHHIVADGWSLGVLLREIAVFYGALRSGSEALLPALALQYADYAVWQRGWLSGEALATRLAEWRERLAGAPPVLELPDDRPRPPVRSPRGGSVPVSLGEETARALRSASRRAGATLFMTLLAAFETLLLRSGSGEDLLIGTPVAGRDRLETEGLIGLFVNTVALRGDLSGDPSFGALLARVRAATLSAFSGQDLPFDKLVEELAPERSLSHAPLVQVTFALQNAPLGPLALPGLSLEPLAFDRGIAQFDLSLTLAEEGGELRGDLEYSADLFDRATVERLARWLRTLAQGIVAGPEARLSELPLLSDSERRHLVVEWNGAPAPRGGRLLARLFAEQAVRSPEAVALLGPGGERLTYRELDQRAERLARRLGGTGVGPDVPVGVFLERSIELVVALLGLWKAGGAFLPLDPGHPEERLAFLLADSGAPVLLTVRELSGRLPATGATVLELDLPGEEDADSEPAGADEASLAWILYTSGSTGRPKPVGVPHGAAAGHLARVAALWELGPGDRVLQFASPGFDVWMEDVVPALLCGATVVIRGAELWEPSSLLSRAAELGISVLNLPTAYWHPWVKACERAELPPGLPLRLVVVGGEAMSPEAARLWFRTPLAGLRLLDGYGPTEAVVSATFFAVSGETAGSGRLGRPLAGRSAYVLDPRGGLLPVGGRGELCLGGPLLARGYPGRPDLTAARFVPDPFAAEWGGEPGGRLYRTGDLSRRGADGDLEFLGRIDHQVKIRGFRVETGEIEAVLAREPEVAEAVVLARPDASGERRLIACVVPASGAEPTAAALRERLAASLPAYMVPSAFVLLDALPLTPNGKVDRRALARMEPEAEAEGDTAARSPVEERLAGIWEELLGVRRAGPGDSFFHLGGHSLLATQVVSRVRSLFGVEIEVRQVFERPTLGALAGVVEERLRAGADLEPPLAPRPAGTDPLPLSFAQSRLWFLDRLEPSSPLYNLPATLRLSGPLSVPALASALAAVALRHEALRTVFAVSGGEPVQRVLPGIPPGLRPLAVADLSILPEALRDAEAERLARAEAKRPFDLERGPLLRATLLRLGALEHRLLLVLHHVVADGWSAGILVRETAALYEAFASGQPSRLPELPVQYADFSLWQRRRLSGAFLERELRFWSELLHGAPPELALPTDRPRPAVAGERGASCRLRLSAGLAERVRALALEAGATPFMVLLAAFEALLARLSGQTDFTVGTPLAGRQRTEVEDLIGFFVNTLVLRADLADDPSFAGLLARTRRHALETYAHQELPFEKLVEHLQPGRHLGRTPLFQAFFVLQNAPAEPLRLPGLVVEPLPVESGTAKFDLTLALEGEGDEFAGEMRWSADLLDEATVRRWAAGFESLLAAALEDPAARLCELPLLSDRERRELLAAWSPSAGPAAPPPLLARIEAWADRTPDAPAVVAEDEILSWRALDERANHLAHRLLALGAGPDVPIAVCLPRSAALVAALLSVLKAGGAYVPLDPDLPAPRLAGLLAGCAAAALITTEELGTLLPAGGPPRLAPGAAGSPVRPERAAAPENLAYVIYTSGSTGGPKGVMVERRQLAAYVDGFLKRAELPPGSSYATVSTFAADLGHTAVFASLATGGALHVPSRELSTSPDRLAAFLERRPVDVLKVVPSHLAALLAAERPERVLPRRLLVLGGETAPWSLLERVRELAPDCRILNHYGPTETTVGVLTLRTWEEDGRQALTVPLGRPLPGARAVLVDAWLQPVPAGLPGELLVGGPQVSRGYLGRPDSTALRFLPDPFGAFGERLYRTGDRARLLPGGALEFLGRIDQQVKIRGFRVEPGEVQAALLSHPAVREALVLGRPTPAGETRLAGYVVPRGEAPDGLGRELRAWLGERLPDAMVPSVIVVLAAFPLTPNGKVDRRALPEPAAEGAAEPAGLCTPTEELLAGLFAELLETGRVGAEDGFFERGGHSLLATRLLARARQAFGVEVELRTLFERPTVRALAARVDELRREGGTPAGPPLVPRDRHGDLPLSFAQERLWFLEQLDPGSAVYNVPRVFRLEGELSAGAFAAALSGIVRRHEAVRTTFALVDGAPVQRVAPAAPVAVPLLDLSALPGPAREAEARHLAAGEAGRPFDLGRGPLLRAFLLRQAREDHVAFVTMHHLASDGWSVGVLVRELTALYGAFAAGRPSPLPELPLQYADFALWQRERLQGETLAAELAWWRSRLDGAPEALEIPADRPRPAVRSLEGSDLPVALDPGASRGLAGLVRRRGATLFMGLLAGFQALLSRYTGQEDLLVGAPVANRNRAEVEGLIGFFVNTLVLRADASGDPSFASFLDRVREQALAAYDHQDLPFEKLVEELRPERSLSRPPLVQVTLALQNAPLAPAALPELRLTPLPGESRTAKFDLSLVFEETADGISGAIEYSTDLFEAATLARLAGHLGVLLSAAAAAPETPLSALPVLSEAERRELLAWNDTGEAGSGGCLHELFEAQAARTPGAVALVDGTRRWTYRELDLRANLLAHRLIRRGVGPEAPVAVCLERTADLPVALLAVLKAGGAYVPLDPAHPRERLAFLLEDSRAAVLITRSGLAEGLAGTIPTLDLEGGEPGGPDRGKPSSGVGPAHLAYVLYTSGSTGRPKGVAVEHRSAAALIHWARRTFSAEELAGVLAATSAGFDLSVFELFAPLSAGGAAILAANALELPDLPAAGEVTLVNTVPSAIAVLARQGGIPPSVRTVNLAGEPLKASLAREVYEASRTERIWNLYGPTEDTTYSTAARVGRSDAREPSIGRPLPGTRAHVLDPGGREVPVGVPGELCLAGAGLARGYLGRPGLTAERFMPDPFSPEPGARLYRTGDLVRRRPGGDLDFLGRLDHQVKIRGVRVELGEIESVLAAHPAVREAVALVRGDDGDRRLVAWVVPANGAAPQPATLREHLRKELPEAMVPGAFVVLKRLPLTPNGKLDRSALPAPEHTPPAAYTAPRNQVEEILAGLWAEVLRAGRVGIHDNFFDLGGHSLLGVRLLSQVRDLFGVTLEVRSLFEQPTVAGMAVAIGQELVALVDEESLVEVWAEVQERRSDV